MKAWLAEIDNSILQKAEPMNFVTQAESQNHRLQKMKYLIYLISVGVLSEHKLMPGISHIS